MKNKILLTIALITVSISSFGEITTTADLNNMVLNVRYTFTETTTFAESWGIIGGTNTDYTIHVNTSTTFEVTFLTAGSFKIQNGSSYCSGICYETSEFEVKSAQASWNGESGNMILQDGNLGIGENNPEAKLEIFSTNTLGSKFQPDLAALKITDGTRTLLADGNEFYSNTDFYFGKPKENNFVFRNVDSNGASDLIYIDKDGNFLVKDGNVSVGYTGVSTKLFVNGDIGIHQTNNSTNGIVWKNGSYAKFSAAIKPVELGAYARQGLGFFTGDFNDKETDAIERMRITQTGNVGIGTTSPSYKLDVLGTIRAQEIKVNLEGADFVFEDDYKLRTLAEVEKFIKENKHLPDIKSAEEMQNSDNNLGELNMQLLQKIEELTLYIIELKKEMEEIRKESGLYKKTNQ